jgi:uncharacterized protein (DUF3084 family)
MAYDDGSNDNSRLNRISRLAASPIATSIARLITIFGGPSALGALFVLTAAEREMQADLHQIGEDMVHMDERITRLEQDEINAKSSYQVTRDQRDKQISELQAGLNGMHEDIDRRFNSLDGRVRCLEHGVAKGCP